MNWVDTAPVYGLGHAEDVVRRALAPYRVGEEVLVFTKCGRRWRDDGDIYTDLRPDAIRDECDASLRRLGIDRIDLEGAPYRVWFVNADLIDEVFDDGTRQRLCVYR